MKLKACFKNHHFRYLFLRRLQLYTHLPEYLSESSYMPVQLSGIFIKILFNCITITEISVVILAT
jgi:hypothetical protein